MAQPDNPTPFSEPGSTSPIEEIKILSEEVASVPVISETDANALKEAPALDGQFERSANNPAKPIVAKNDGVRELLETVVFVVVLVLVLKSFIAEAFVIPTGSMAETLFGYQKQINCLLHFLEWCNSPEHWAREYCGDEVLSAITFIRKLNA